MGLVTATPGTTQSVQKAISQSAAKGTYLKSNPYPRLLNDTFCLRVTFSQTGFYQFIRFDSAGKFIVYNARNYPQWLVFRMWHMGMIYPSPRINELFSEKQAAILKMESEHRRKVLEDVNKQKLKSKLKLGGI